MRIGRRPTMPKPLGPGQQVTRLPAHRGIPIRPGTTVIIQGGTQMRVKGLRAICSEADPLLRWSLLDPDGRAVPASLVIGVAEPRP
jgi:hypothetical protein